MTTQANELGKSVESAMQCVEACAAVRSIYAQLQIEIDHRKPICVASGKCCNFESYGHRLYVTTLELATFMQDLKGLAVARMTRAPGPCAEPSNRTSLKLLTHHARAGGTGGPCHDEAPSFIGLACPLQEDRLCSVHAIRPFGCRIFFCDPTAEEWQQRQYELFHTELKQLHDVFEIPYLYVEWRAALRALGI